MAPKQQNLLDAPPAAASEEEETTCSEEEEEDSEEEGSSLSEEEEQQTQNPMKRVSSSSPQKTQIAKPAGEISNPATQEAESEYETETETESESDNNGPSSNVKPIASKPIAGKRGNDVESEAKDSKRVKRDSDSNLVAENAKKQLFQRLWSEDDEIVVLKGMIDFAEKKGIDPSKNMNSFCDFIKKSLHFNVTLSQLKDKVSRLKKRFDNHMIKGKKNGEDKAFSKPHEQKLFDLSKKIWGSGPSVKMNNGKAKSNNAIGKNLAALKAELGVGVKESEMEMEYNLGMEGITKRDDYIGIEEYVINKGLDVVDGAKKEEMVEKWNELGVAELELFRKRKELIKEQAELMLARYQ